MASPMIVMSQESGIDVSVPADNVRVVKGDMRDNFRAASDSIEALQRRMSLTWQVALGDVSMLN